MLMFGEGQRREAGKKLSQALRDGDEIGWGWRMPFWVGGGTASRCPSNGDERYKSAYSVNYFLSAYNCIG